MAAEPSGPAQLAKMRDPPLLGGVEDDGQRAAALLLNDSLTPQHRAGEPLAAGTVDNPSNPSNPSDQTNNINDHLVIPPSQETIPSTQGPASPLLSDPSASFKTELNEPDDSPAISSSLTPPPSSQFPPNRVGPAAEITTMTPATAPEPVTARRDGASAAAASPAAAAKHFATPTAQQMADASADELRRLLQASLAEHARLKMEAAHHKLQFQLLSLQADDDAKRAAVEHDMMRREVQALRAAEQMARRSAIFSKATSGATAAAAAVESSAAATAQRNLQLQSWCDRLVADNEALDRRWRLAKKVIRQKDSELMDLRDERDMALNRIRENREHMQILCSPGGMFHGAYTPKAGQQHQHQAMSAATPGQYGATNPGGSKATPRHSGTATGKPPPHGDREPGDQGKERFAALLQALSQDNNNSVPSTPINAGAGYQHQASAHQRLGSVSGVRALGGARTASLRHTRNVQSMSSLPTTPAARTIDGLLRAVHPGSGPTWGPGHGAGLLPSVDLVPQSAPSYRRGQESGRGGAYGSESRFPPQTPSRPMTRDRERRKSRESTISADEMEPEEENNEELARQALQSVAAAASHVAGAAGGKGQSERMTHSTRRSGRRDSKLSPQKMARSGKKARDDDGHGAGTVGRGQQQQQQQENKDDDDKDNEEVQESQASLEALEMLRRDPRESFDVISSAEGSRDGTPELGAGGRLQKRLLVTGAAAREKRKFSASSSSSNSNNKNINNGGARGKAGGRDDQAPGDDAAAAGKRELGSPTKRLRVAGGLRGDSRRVGLGIQYSTGT